MSGYYFDLADKLGLEWTFIFEHKVPVLFFSNSRSSRCSYHQVILLVKSRHSLSQTVGKLDDTSYNSSKDVTGIERVY